MTYDHKVNNCLDGPAWRLQTPHGNTLPRCRCLQYTQQSQPARAAVLLHADRLNWIWSILRRLGATRERSLHT